MTQCEVALFVHLLGVGLLAAGMGAAAAGLERGRRRELPAEVAALLGVARVGVLLVGVGSLTLLVGGFWLMQIGAYDLGDGWLSASLGLFLLGALLGALGGRRPKQARLRAERLLRERGARGRAAAAAARRPRRTRSELRECVGDGGRAGADDREALAEGASGADKGLGRCRAHRR